MRRGGDRLVVISWRDIPAQVNASSGANKHQVVLPRRFQRAIDEAAIVAGKKSASDYVAEWRRAARPLPEGEGEGEGGVDLEGAANAEADRLKAEFPPKRLSAYVATGGWDPDRPADERT